jgi:hypothetical protein
MPDSAEKHKEQSRSHSDMRQQKEHTRPAERWGGLGDRGGVYSLECAPPGP